MALFREDSIRSRDSGWFACAYAFLNGAWDKIELELGTSLKFFLIYKLTKIELVALKEFI
jgi:hypothetical protein